MPGVHKDSPAKKHAHIFTSTIFTRQAFSLSYTHTNRYLWDSDISLQTLYLHIVRLDWQISLSMRCVQRPRGGSLSLRYFVLCFRCALENTTFIMITLKTECAVTSLCWYWSLTDSETVDLLIWYTSLSTFPCRSSRIDAGWRILAKWTMDSMYLDRTTKMISQTLWHLVKTPLNHLTRTFFFPVSYFLC